MKWAAPPIWEGGECWIIGGGSSVLTEFDVPDDVVRALITRGNPERLSPYLEPIHRKHVIGINNAFRIGPWIDVMFFGDCGWYPIYREELARFPGLKVTCCPRFNNRAKEQSEGVKFLAKDTSKREGITEDRSKVSWNSNSGAAAISLAHHFGVRRIILLGFDMKLSDFDSKISHWHGSHGGQKPPPFPRHLRGFPAIAADAERLGIEIVNANPNSAIECFPKVSVKELL
jgi:hypothetical protein